VPFKQVGRFPHLDTFETRSQGRWRTRLGHMKRVRLLGLLGSVFLTAVAACSTNAGSDSEASSNAIEVSDVPAASLAEVKKETGRDGVSARPIFEPDSFEPAYYEVQLNPGWAVVSAASIDNASPHVVEWSLSGRSPTERLDLGARAAMKR